jgi:hypothetical protein
MQALSNLFSWLVTALFGVLFLLLVYEDWALITNHTPITDYIRPAVHDHPAWAFVIAVVVGILLGHCSGPDANSLNTRSAICCAVLYVQEPLPGTAVLNTVLFSR